ncbi:MAG: retropepsin-like aspartic protease [Thermodesulfovibrionia bacterium]|nr:retropepsin-like aspartic protease [Thermodesulfovibrionia bacterium]
MNQNQYLFIILFIFINLISCSTTERAEHPKNILSHSDLVVLENTLNDRNNLSSLLRNIAMIESELRLAKNPYDVENSIKRVENQREGRKEEIANFKRRIENTEIFLKNNSDDTLSLKLASFKANLRKYEEIINESEERFKQSQYQFQLLKDQYLADTRKKDARRKFYKEHILKGIDDIGINSEYIFSNESSIGIIESLYYFQKRIYLTVKLIVLPHSHASIEDFHLYDKYIGHLGSPEDKSNSWLYDYRDESEPNVYIYKRVFSSENIHKNGELKIILHGSNVNYEKTLKYAELDYGKTIPVSNDDFSKRDIKEKDFVSEITKIQGKRKGNHLLLPVRLDIHGDEIDTELLLDTGASITTIPYDLYKRGNPISLTDLKKEQFQTANGIVIAYIDRFKLKTSAYTKEIEVAIINNDVSLLGANYFEGNVYTIDLTNECIYIHPKYIQN